LSGKDFASWPLSFVAECAFLSLDFWKVTSAKCDAFMMTVCTTHAKRQGNRFRIFILNVYLPEAIRISSYLKFSSLILTYLTPWSRIVLGKILVAEPLKTLLNSMEPESSLLCTQESTIYLYLKTDEFSPHPYTLFIVILPCDLSMGLVSKLYFCTALLKFYMNFLSVQCIFLVHSTRCLVWPLITFSELYCNGFDQRVARQQICTATIEEAVFSVDPTDAPIDWLDSDPVICVYCRSMSVPRL
jgi:hypothetical protein